MRRRYPAKYRLIMWVVLLLPLLYVLVFPPIYHLGNRAITRIPPRREFQALRWNLSKRLDACARPYWLLAGNSPLPIEAALFEYDAQWENEWPD